MMAHQVHVHTSQNPVVTQAGYHHSTTEISEAPVDYLAPSPDNTWIQH